MKLELGTKGLRMTDALRSFVERKLRSALGRLGHRVRRVQVMLTDVNGPRGGDDILCLIRADLGRAGAVTIKETRSGAFEAVARASERTSQRLSRHLSRTHTVRRGRRGR